MWLVLLRKQNLLNYTPDIRSLATKTVLNAVENKIASVSSLVKKQTMTQKLVSLKKQLTDHNHDKYINTPNI